MKKRCIVLDTETTGLDYRSGDEIIEMGLVEIVDSVVGEGFNFRYRPTKPINIMAQNVHSLSLFDLLDSPKLNTPELKKLGEFLNGDDLIIHNATFDMGMLNEAYAKFNMNFSNYHGKVIDTLKVARAVFKGTNQKCNLDALCDYYFIDKSIRVYHGALIDCYLLADLFLKLLPEYFNGDYVVGNNGDEEIKFDADFERFIL